MTHEEIIAAVESMTVLELADLVKAMEEKFGVSAAATAVVAGPAAGAAAPAAEEKTEFDVVLADAGSKNAVQDGSLVMGNLMLAAASLRLGSCWINRAKEEFESEEGKALLKKWGIEGDYAGIGHCILGYAAEGGEAPAKPRKEDYVVRVQG